MCDRQCGKEKNRILSDSVSVSAAGNKQSTASRSVLTACLALLAPVNQLRTIKLSSSSLCRRVVWYRYVCRRQSCCLNNPTTLWRHTLLTTVTRTSDPKLQTQTYRFHDNTRLQNMPYDTTLHGSHENLYRNIISAGCTQFIKYTLIESNCTEGCFP